MTLVPKVKQPLVFHVLIQGLGLAVILLSIIAFAAIRHFELFELTLTMSLNYTLIPAVPTGLVMIFVGLAVKRIKDKQNQVQQAK